MKKNYLLNVMLAAFMMLGSVINLNAQTIIDLTEGDAGSLNAAIGALEGPSVIVLGRDMTYDCGANISQDVTIMTEAGSGARAVLNMSNLDVSGGSDLALIKIYDVEMQGDIGGNYAMNIDEACDIDEFIIENSYIHNLRGVFRAKTADVVVGKFAINNCTVDSIGSYGVVIMDNAAAVCSEVVFSNSTFSNCYQLARWRDAGTADTLLVENCNLYSVPDANIAGGGGYFIRAEANPMAGGVGIVNSILGLSNDRLKNGTATITSVGSYITSDCALKTADFDVAPTAYAGASTDLWMDPGTDGDYDLKDMAFAGKDMAGNPSAFSNKTVVFVTQETDYFDSVVIDAIDAYMDSSVYDVTVLRKNVIDYTDKAQLNAADVVIMGRNIPSGSVSDGGIVWDSITSPVLSMNMWGMRSSRAKWTISSSCANITSSNDTILEGNILMPNDPAFNGVAGSAIGWWSGQFSIFGADPKRQNSGNGILLAETVDGSPLFMRWEANKEFYPGSGRTPMGPRSYIGNGADSDSVNYFGFTDASKVIFFNELNLLASDLIPVIPTPEVKEVVFVTQETDYFDSVVIDAIDAYMDSSVYDVTVLRKNVIDYTDKAQLNAADVVIMGRNIPSGSVSDGGIVWDSITSPVISMNMWGMRSSRAKWTISSSCANITSNNDTVLKANLTMPNDPAFKYVSGSSIDWWSGQFSIFGADAKGDNAGNGILLAEGTDGSPLFMRWAAGKEFYPGSGRTPMGPRSYIGNGADSDSINYFGFTDAGKMVFFNELHLMTNPELIPEIKTEVKEILFVTNETAYFDSVVIDAIAGYIDSSVYNVTVLRKNVVEMSDVPKMDSADVVIIGRNIGSADVGTSMAVYDSTSSSVLSMNMWGMRSSRAKWTPSGTCENITSNSDTILAGTILDINDPAFSYITSTNQDWWAGQFSIFGVDAEDDDIGNGVILAETSDGRPLLMRWSPDYEFYPGSEHTPNGYRSYIGNGADSDSVNYFGFTDAGKMIFFNELHLMANPELIPTITPRVVEIEEDCSLASLVPSEGTLNPAFASATTDYALSVPEGTTVTFTTTTTASTATVAGADGTAAGSTASIVVTDGDSECTYSVVITGTVSVNDIEAAGISLYPNPAKSNITLTNLAENSNVVIFNTVGQVVYQTVSNNGNLEVNINNIESGMYMVKIEMNGSVYTSRFIKQ